MEEWRADDASIEPASPRRRRESATRALALLALALALSIVAGTVYGFATNSRQKKIEREADRAQAAAELAGRVSCSGLGTIRAKSADAKAAVIVATIAFPYDSVDKPFAEELSRKAPVLKATAVSVLSSKKAAELAPAFEGSLKAALRDAFNARLSLGKVSEIWLSDFAVIQ
jgi:flagellar basal body-associated protein FliL